MTIYFEELYCINLKLTRIKELSTFLEENKVCFVATIGPLILAGQLGSMKREIPCWKLTEDKAF